MKDLKVSFPEPCAEKYDDMKPQGCNRFCGSCSKIIYDLSQYDIDEVEQLINENDDICVRAEVNCDGNVRLKPQTKRKPNNARRMIVAASASLGMMATACQSVPNNAAESLSGPNSDMSGAIKGQISHYIRYGKKIDYIIAFDGEGREYKTKINRHGKYKLSNLPVGEYGLAFESRCESFVSEIDVIVKKSQITQYDIKPEVDCIVVGKLEIQERQT